MPELNYWQNPKIHELQCNTPNTLAVTPNIEEFHKRFYNSIKHVLKELFITRFLSTEKFWKPPWHREHKIRVDGALAKKPRWRKGDVCLAAADNRPDFLSLVWILFVTWALSCVQLSDKVTAGLLSHEPAVYDLKLHISHRGPGQQSEKLIVNLINAKLELLLSLAGWHYCIVSSLPTNSC